MSQFGPPQLRVLALLFIVGAHGIAAESGGSGPCDGSKNARVENSSTLAVDGAKTIRQLAPEFFGFNIEWLEFQLSLWDSTARGVRPEVVDAMKVFAGATYRYPGGTSSDYFHAPTALGPLGQRPQQPLKAVSWHGPIPAEFGPIEFLEFVKQVAGKPWYVLNLHGTIFQERPTSALAADAAIVTRTVTNAEARGLPGIFRWELGNELDRPPFSWSPEKYVERASAIRLAVSGVSPIARFVAGLQDWDASKKQYGVTKEEYNAKVAKGLKGSVDEYASHRYYDGRPGRSVPFELQQLCRTDDALRGPLTRHPDFWITEHGRTPSGDPQSPEWKKQWPTSGDLGAAISVADMLISLAQMPGVNGSMVHALHGTDGPWPLFHRGKSGIYHPSVVYWAMRMLRQTMLEDVLGGMRVSDPSGYEGGYSLNGVVLSNRNRSRYALWLINRSGQRQQMHMKIPSLANQRRAAKFVQLTSDGTSSSDYELAGRVLPSERSAILAISGSGDLSLTISPNSVVAVTF